ncbi:hypothetical protein SmaMPs15_000079 [Stenotrophomonas maltophilia phage vB_SmaM_Ps15]|uniref:Uncharacterized protein n=1 Tax=Stenotrophomonas maltophilia phage vB_SmaM_Ps15 TaxID=3071007 RepID=A0AAE9FRG5_9CAUD|nr:hypothetical protein PQC01_gp079 [Stenotrophomonas maltophilia phage vB_SmaM_Ps15]UMO77230.1 hypothetical protein SmaMPs15_000079 [Stenotrophomonas maltophilia phage vB_SmaM_Ps15]
MKEMYRIVNSQGDQIGPLYSDVEVPIKELRNYARDKRGQWIPYKIEILNVVVVGVWGEE